ncbi:MAG: LamG-like jellyroll fold domain-containing protein, partial [Planctomycetaceae bacterium]
IHVSGIGNGSPQGTVSWWRAEGNATDAAGNNDGTLFNGATFAAGQSGQGWRFDSPPFASNSDQILVADDPSLDLTTVTIDAWFRLDVLPVAGASSIILEKGVTTSSENYGLTIGLGTGGLGEVQFSWHDGTTFRLVQSSGANIAAGKYYHVAATADGTTVRLYLDGQLIHEVSQASPLVTNNGPLYIGSNEGSGFGNRFQGTIDELAIYNRALTATEIFALHAAGGQTKIGSTIQGNFIGTNATGTADLGNAGDGIEINGSPANFIGGTTAAERNVISGNDDHGVNITGTDSVGNTIQGNYIGTDVTGTFAVANGNGSIDSGIFIGSGADNVIGGTAAGEGNVISGNFFAGIDLNSTATTGTIIQGNFIGVNAAGTAALGNEFAGINIFQATGSLIGGTDPGAGNVISGSLQSDGILIIDGSGHVIQGNFVGTDASGTLDLGNDLSGVRLSDASNNTIGGDTPAERNVISGNTASGVFISGTAATGNVIAGNFIGTNAVGDDALGNGNSGITVTADGNLIGGTLGNVVSGNVGQGIYLPGSNNQVLGNFIGTTADGLAALGNTLEGVAITGGGNVIGGTTGSARNVISGNAIVGIQIEDLGGPGSGEGNV